MPGLVSVLRKAGVVSSPRSGICNATLDFPGEMIRCQQVFLFMPGARP